VSIAYLPVIVGSPASFSDAEIGDFVAFVCAGGEVASDGLEARVRAAEQLSFIRHSVCLLGIAGLKKPSRHYRDEVSKGSGVDLREDTFPYELGWVFVLPSARGNHLAEKLCKPLLDAADNKGIFATTKLLNDAMHVILPRLGFLKSGIPYDSNRSAYKLQLFTRAQ